MGHSINVGTFFEEIGILSNWSRRCQKRPGLSYIRIYVKEAGSPHFMVQASEDA